MIIETLWIVRRGETSPEMLTAWDDISIQENPDGFKKECDAALAAVGDEVEAHRYIVVNVPDVELAFQRTYVEGEVISS